MKYPLRISAAVTLLLLMGAGCVAPSVEEATTKENSSMQEQGTTTNPSEGDSVTSPSDEGSVDVTSEVKALDDDMGSVSAEDYTASDFDETE